MSKYELKNGSLLVSMPFLNDVNFERSVVLLCEHSDKGSFGLILNQPTITKLSDFELFDNYDDTVYIGGPVEQNTMHFIHSLKNLDNAFTVSDKLKWGGDFELLKERINAGEVSDSQIRFYLGYSGWDAGQLEQELNENLWVVNNNYSLNIFTLDPNILWRSILLEMGGEYAQLANYPIDPSLN